MTFSFQDSQPDERVPDEWTGCGSTGIVKQLTQNVAEFSAL